MKHSIVSPSKAHIWTNCTCYESRPSSSAGQQGTEYHAMAEEALKEGTEPAYPVKQYVDFVRSKEGDLEVERTVPLRWLAPKYHGDLGQGYCDAVIYNVHTIEIIDLKTGKIPVSPVNNLQLMIYAYCVTKDLMFLYDLVTLPKEITLTIFQFDEPSSWSLTWEELENFIQTKIEPKVYLVLSGEKVRKLGDYCQWCTKKSECKPLIKELDNVSTDPVELLQKAKLWQDLAEEVKTKIKDSGVSPDDRIAISEQVRLKWKNDAKLPEDLYIPTPIRPSKMLLETRPELQSMVDETIVKSVGLKK